MQNRSNDPAAIAGMVNVGPIGSGTKNLLHQEFIASELIEGLQQADKAEGFDSGRPKFEALPSPDVSLCSCTCMGERI